MRVDPLPRRAFVGLELDADGHVRSVDVGGPAERAGIGRGDAFFAIDGIPIVGDPSELRAALKVRRAGETMVLSVARAGERLERTVTLAPLPIESFDDATTELGHVRLGTHRLRTIVTRPIAERAPRRDAVLLLPGLDCASVEHPLEANHPTRSLVEAFSRADLVTMRVERSGVGDSEGPPCSETGLDEELATHAAAIDALIERDDVDPSRIFLFAPSLGGMIAPLLARHVELAGIVVFGSSARVWDDCVTRTMIRQKKLAGASNEELASFVARWAELVALVVREGWTPEEVFRELAHLRGCRGRDAEGRTLFGRDVALFQALAKHDLVAAWRAVRSRVLVLHGEHDWVSSLEEAREIADAARAELDVLPSVGHDLCAHDSLRACFERKITGKNDPRVAERIVAWIKRA
jgi:pimeloyl-ACP methyl ester carboxylesterase